MKRILIKLDKVLIRNSRLRSYRKLTASMTSISRLKMKVLMKARRELKRKVKVIVKKNVKRNKGRDQKCLNHSTTIYW